MRLLFVVQRYGPDIAGGAEQLIRDYTLRLAARGHDVEVLTSCATSYADWMDDFPSGTSSDGAVTVHRLRVVAPRPNELFGPLHQRVTTTGRRSARYSPVVATAWCRMIGPELDGLDDWLTTHAGSFDAVVFSGYLYSPSTQGLPAVSALAPTILQPVAHDETTLRIPMLRQMFDHATAINFLTDEERELVDLRFRPPGLRRVFGAGVAPLPEHINTSLVDRFGVSDAPYLVCVGRIDPAKGMHELAGYFRTYRERHDQPLKLVFVGSEVHQLERHPDIVVTGFVDEATRWALVDGAAVLAQPSFFESFSLSLAEGWRCGKPALVQARNDVLIGQVRRAEGGLGYTSYAEFDAALQLLLESEDRRTHFGISGRNYVEQYNWSTILDSFERLLNDAQRAWHDQRRRVAQAAEAPDSARGPNRW